MFFLMRRQARARCGETSPRSGTASRDGADKDPASAALDEDGEEEADEEASEQMLGIVKAMAFQGQNLLTSPQYQAIHA